MFVWHLADVSLNPSVNALPGGGTLQDLTNGLGAWALIAALANGDITGTVTDSTNHRPLPTVEITLSRGPQVVANTSTGSFGTYTIHNVPNGTYTVKIDLGSEVSFISGSADISSAGSRFLRGYLGVMDVVTPKRTMLRRRFAVLPSSGWLFISIVRRPRRTPSAMPRASTVRQWPIPLSLHRQA